MFLTKEITLTLAPLSTCLSRKLLQNSGTISWARIFWSGAHDTEFLEKCEVSVSGKLMFDTQVLSLALLPDGPPVYGLKKLLEDLKIPFDEEVLHNGGNDAFYTLKAFLSLAKLELQ